MISVRFGEKTRHDVAWVARASGRTESAVVREAIEECVGRWPARRPYETLQDVIGMVEEGPAGLSERKGATISLLPLERDFSVCRISGRRRFRIVP